MNLTTIPDPSAFEIGTFACAGRHLVHTATTGIDAMNSTAALWIASHDLRPPT